MDRQSTDARSSDDGLLTLEATASALGVSLNRLLNWLENNEWLVLGDSYSVVWGQVEAGNLAQGRGGGMRVTRKGLEIIRRDIGVTSAPSSDTGTDIPF